MKPSETHSSTDLGLLAELHLVLVAGGVGVHHARAVLPGRLVVDAVHVRHHDEQVRLYLCGEKRRETVVVLYADTLGKTSN